jgi:hypothetical protein
MRTGGNASLPAWLLLDLSGPRRWRDVPVNRDFTGGLSETPKGEIKLSDSKKKLDQQEKLHTARLPQKNAEPPPAAECAKHEEEVLDEALESTFPASDPIAEAAPKCTPEQLEVLEVEEEITEHEEFLLDEALELTFPASDPIAVPDPDTVARIIAHHHHMHR